MDNNIIISPVHYIFESNLAMTINSMSFTIFLLNTIHSIKLILKNQNQIFQLNLIQSLIGLIVNLLIIIFFFSFDNYCLFRIQFAAVGNLLSTLSIELILLIKAKLVLSSLPKYIYPLALVLMAIKLVLFCLNMVFTSITITPLLNCSANMDMLYAGMALTIQMILNIYLTSIFLIIIYKQYKFNQLPFYKMILKDGIIYSLIILFVDIFICILAFAQILNQNSAVLFNISWAITSLLTVLQLRKHQKLRNKRLSHRMGKNSKAKLTEDSNNFNETKSTMVDTLETHQTNELNEIIYTQFNEVELNDIVVESRKSDL